MAYTGYTKVGPFVNGATPALNAVNINKLEQGIYDIHYPWLSATAATAGITSYPLGISYLSVSGDSSWPNATGVLKNVKMSTTQDVQTFYTYPASGTPEVWWREWVNASSSWTAWLSMGGVVGLTVSKALISGADGKVATSTVSSTELGYLSGVTSSIQAQLNGKQATLSLTASRALVSNASGAVAVSTATATEVGYLSGVTSAIQTQLNAKQATITGAASTIATSNLTADRVLIANASGKVANSTVTSTELGYLSGVSSSVQTQLNGKQAVVSGVDSTKIGYLSGVTSDIQTQLNGKQGIVANVTDTKLSYLVNVTSDIQAQLDAKQGATTVTASRALVSNTSGLMAASAVTAVELGYLSGVTSAVQTQLNSKQATLTGGATSIVSSNLTASRALVSDASGKVGASTVTATELGYLSGLTGSLTSLLGNKQDKVTGVSDAEIGYLANVTSDIQTQLDSKLGALTGAASTITNSNLTASRALISDASGKVGISTVTSTELSYLSGATSNLQTQINNVAAGALETITGAASTITTSNLTANRALIANIDGKVAVANVTKTELEYLAGTTSNVQTQINTIANRSGDYFVHYGILDNNDYSAQTVNGTFKDHGQFCSFYKWSDYAKMRVRFLFRSTYYGVSNVQWYIHLESGSYDYDSPTVTVPNSTYLSDYVWDLSGVVPGTYLVSIRLKASSSMSDEVLTIYGLKEMISF